MSVKWSDAEKHFLTKHYTKFNQKRTPALFKQFHNTIRTPNAIKTMACRLGLGKTIEESYFSIAEIMDILNGETDRKCVLRYAAQQKMAIRKVKWNLLLSHDDTDQIIRYFTPPSSCWMKLTDLERKLGYPVRSLRPKFAHHNIPMIKYKSWLYVPTQLVEICNEWLSENELMNWKEVKKQIKPVDFNPLHAVK